MKRHSLALAALLASASVMAQPANLKDESIMCPPQQSLFDGFYVGAAAGYDTYRVNGFWNNSITEVGAPPTFINGNGHVVGKGGVLGGFVGFGKYFADFYGLYLGLELFGNWSDAGASAHLSTSPEVPTLPTNGPPGTYLINQQLITNFKVTNNLGISFLPGYKLNSTSVLYVRLGYNWSKIEVKQSNFNNASFEDHVGVVTFVGNQNSVTSGCQYTHGFNYGVGLESAFEDNLSVRGEYTHTNYNSFSTLSSITDNQFMIGMIYHF
jgi:outer membrane immunogenic protein